METWHQICRLKFCEEKHPLKLFDSLKLLGYFNQLNLSCTSKLVRLGYFSKEIQFDHLSSWVKSVRGMPLWDLHTAVLQLAKNCFQDIPIGSKWIQIMACCFFLFSRNNNKSSSQQSSSSSSSSSLSSCSSSSALAQELSQQTAVIPESDSNSQVDWTYDPNEPRYCICNQVRMSSSLKYNWIYYFTVGELSPLFVYKQIFFFLNEQNFSAINSYKQNVFIYLPVIRKTNSTVEAKTKSFPVICHTWRVLSFLIKTSGTFKFRIERVHSDFN